MEMDEEMDVFSSGGAYKYILDITKHEDCNTFKGISKNKLKYSVNYEVASELARVQFEDLGAHSIHAMCLEEEEILKYKSICISSSHVFMPYLDLKPPPGKLQNKRVVIGGNIGVPLLQFLDKKNKICEYNKDGKYKSIGAEWRRVGKWLGARLYKEHCADRFIGNLLNSTFVDAENQKVVFVPNPKHQATFPTTEAGITDDLKNLHKLVKWVETNFPTQTTPASDVNVFNDIYSTLSTSLQTSLEHLKEFSYFMCHSFLYYEVEQRFAFCQAYRRIRQTFGESDFQFHVDLQTAPSDIKDDWHTHRKLNSIFIKVYNKEVLAHAKAHGLLHFFRSCRRHYNHEAATNNVRHPTLSDDELDEIFNNLFPNAIPKVFRALIRSSVDNQLIIKIMRLEGLDS